MEMVQTKKESLFNKRIHEIDFFRGVLILLVILDHFFIYFRVYLRNKGVIDSPFLDWYLLPGNPRTVIQPLALAGFCFVSGISCVFSKNNYKRSFLCLGIWAILLISTNVLQVLKNNGLIFDQLQSVDFAVDLNIIGVLGFCMLFYSLVQKKTWRSLLVIILISFLISSYLVPNLRINLINIFDNGTGIPSTRPGQMFINGVPSFPLPIFWERIPQGDFVPLFPYIIAFFLGCLFSYFFYKKNKKSIIKYKGEWERPICFMGRHTLVIYFLQFVVIVGFFSLLMVLKV